MLRSGVTPRNRISEFDLRHDQVSLFRATAPNTYKSQGKRAVARTRGGIPPTPKAMRNAQSERRGCEDRGALH